MSEIRVDSDRWTGRDPARAVPAPPPREMRRRLRRGLVIFAGGGLVLFGYRFGTLEAWADLISPVFLISFSSALLAWGPLARK